MRPPTVHPSVLVRPPLFSKNVNSPNTAAAADQSALRRRIPDRRMRKFFKDKTYFKWQRERKALKNQGEVHRISRRGGFDMKCLERRGGA